MSKLNLPLLNPSAIHATKNKIEDGILARWDKTLLAESSDKNTVDIFDAIGEDFFGSGFTAKRMSAALRSIGPENDVTVNINSPGGDFFEGAAIYNLLAEHKGKVTVNVAGLAASAASVIAMAGDVIKISQVGFLMIHNAWGVVVGNRHDMTKASDVFSVFDASMRDLYAARTGNDKKSVEKLMDSETWLNAQDAVDQGFASEVIQVKTGDGSTSDKKSKAMAKRTIEMALAQHGVSKKEREEILLRAGVRDVAEPVLRDADDEEWKSLIKSMTS